MPNGSGMPPENLKLLRNPRELSQKSSPNIGAAPSSFAGLPLGLSSRASVQKLPEAWPPVQLACAKPSFHSRPSTITSNPFQLRESSGAWVNRMSPVEYPKSGVAYSYTVSCWLPPPGSRESAGPVKGIADQLLASTAVLSAQRKLPNSRRIHFALIDQLLPSSCSTPTL